VNLPGTSTEHPNWQRKLSRDVDALFASGAVQSLCRRLGAERGKWGHSSFPVEDR
jgi:4-alpha-glucanotransferase